MLNYFNSSTIYVSQTEGDDGWSGFCEKPQPQYRFGPLKTLECAIEKIARMRCSGIRHPMTVCVIGDYFLEKPVGIGSAFYHTAAGLAEGIHPSGEITVKSHPRSKARIIGGRKITGLREGEINGVRCLCADLPDVREGKWSFTDLVVNGRRASLARYPREGTLRAVTTEHPTITSVHDQTSSASRWFVARKEDLADVPGVEHAIVSFYHWWIDEHCPVERYDPETGRIDLACRTRFNITAEYDQDFTGNLEYYLENIPTQMCAPGEWYLDHGTGTLYYIPCEGETGETVEMFAPVTKKLFHIAGQPGNPVCGVRLQNLELLCSRGDYMSLDENGEPRGADVQAVHAAYGAVTFEYAGHCTLENCRLYGLGLHAVEILRGCSSIRIENCTLEQLGGGGIKVFGAPAEELEHVPETATHHITVRGCRIRYCGRRFAAACGIMICHAHSNEIAGNEICWLDYSGVSVGWVWGFGPNCTYGNLIADNHIHHIGMGRLSDMGGIYLLGKQPGTVVRGNHIHDVMSNHYGGNGIYADEGASYVTFENNLVYRCKSASYTEHYGSHNVVRDNIFAFGGICLVNNGPRDDASPAFVLEHNIFLTDGEPVYEPLVSGQRSCRNLIWDVKKGKPLLCRYPTVETLEDWQRIFGRDEGSIIADPGFADALHDDFTLPEDSPFYSL